MKKVLAILMLLAMVFALAACGDTPANTPAANDPTPPPAGDPTPDPAPPPAALISVGIVNLHPSESGYREANVADMDAVFNETNGYEVKKANYNEVNEQIDAAQQFITEGVQYLLISGANAEGWTEVLTNAKNAGIKVFLFDRTLNVSEDLYEAQVISDMEAEGKTAVDWLIAQNLDVYNIVHIQGQLGSAAQKGRSGALEAQIAANDNWNLIFQGTGGDTWSPDEAKRHVESAIASGKDFNVIYAENDGMAEGAMFALQDANITHGVNGKVLIMGFDYNRWALKYVLDGDWNYDGQCSPFQAKIIDEIIKGVRTVSDKTIINPEGYFDNTNITLELIEAQGVNEMVRS